MTTSENNPQEDTYVTAVQACRQLGVSASTVHNWVDQGLLNSWRTAGGHRRISQKSINELLAKRELALQGSRAEALDLLLVEDDPHLIDFFKTFVTSWPFSVDLTIAQNGYDGLLQAGLKRPDMIVTDLAMPEMDGFAMIRAILKTEELQGVHIVVITGLDEKVIEEHGGIPEGIPLFIKPAPYGQLLELATHIIQTRSATPTTGLPS
ncbi:response regulator [Magnetococcus sp. PR-3]|uniref:response regulator n=1 Tax=Magnetococcus sp. PR-3 TaxID=3120355 RepID=UPI002FCE5402